MCKASWPPLWHCCDIMTAVTPHLPLVVGGALYTMRRARQLVRWDEMAAGPRGWAVLHRTVLPLWWTSSVQAMNQTHRDRGLGKNIVACPVKPSLGHAGSPLGASPTVYTICIPRPLPRRHGVLPVLADVLVILNDFPCRVVILEQVVVHIPAGGWRVGRWR